MSVNLMDMFQDQLSKGLVDQLSQQLGGADKQQTMTAASGIFTTLMGALSKNASNPEGAQALNNALERDHDGSILNDLAGLLNGNNQQIDNPRSLNGAGILEHILGNKQNSAIDIISQISGLESNKTGNLMTMLAPVVMGMLGKTKREQGLDVMDIASLLNNNVSNQKQQNNPTMDLVSRFLDSDGDGSIVDDLANMGMKMLGGFLSRKR
ncbi:MAG TPA: DUF937 domain-containing protein [Saprospiraceae bacterium]|nr:DUF937 domain-containing protein [Saprospiraceae bacterium]HMQ84419.1 DUF937 domain-containing protein [Saprospiraceae bacterium]